MAVKIKKSEKLKKRFIEKYRIILLNEGTFDEVFSIRLNLLNVFLFVSFTSLLLISSTTVLIAFTPLREYIPGYASTDLRRKSIELATKTDSLERVINCNTAYINSIQKVFSGDLEYAKINIDSIIKAENENLPDLNFETTEAELNLREEVNEKDK